MVFGRTGSITTCLRCKVWAQASTATDTVTVTSLDGTTQAITVTINGTDDPDAVINGDITATLTEDESVNANGDLVASGQLKITDADAGEAFFNAATVPGAHGSLTITPDGGWTYEVDNDLPAVQGLGAGQFLTDTVTVTSLDGTAQDITITINSADEPPLGPTPEQLFVESLNYPELETSFENTLNFLHSNVYKVIQDQLAFIHPVSWSESPKSRNGFSGTDIDFPGIGSVWSTGSLPISAGNIGPSGAWSVNRHGAFADNGDFLELVGNVSISYLSESAGNTSGTLTSVNAKIGSQTLTVSGNFPVNAFSNINGTIHEIVYSDGNETFTFSGTANVFATDPGQTGAHTWSISNAQGTLDYVTNEFSGSLQLNSDGTLETTSAQNFNAIDGYIEGATVFADADRDGQLDPGEAFDITGVDGAFSLERVDGPIIMQGQGVAVDASTGLEFKGQLEAPIGSTVVTPLTTLINKLVESGEDLVVAQSKVKSAFGITSEEDLTTLDPIAAALSGGLSSSAGVEITALGVSLQNLALQAGSALRGASDVEQGVDGSLTFADATEAVFRSLAEQILDLPPETDLSVSQAQFEDLLNDAAVKAGLGVDAQDHLASSAGDIARVMLSGVDALDELSANPIEALKELAQTAVILQHEASVDIEAAVEAAASGDPSALSALLSSFTGEALDAAIEAASIGNISGSLPVSVQTIEHVARVAIPSDIGDLSQSERLDVSIEGVGFSPIDFEFAISPGQTPQSVADQLRNEIQNRLGGPGQEALDVRIETGEAGEASLVLQSSVNPITTNIDFESVTQGQSGTRNINTVALPDEGELSEGDTLELTLTVDGPSGPASVVLQQTLEGGETLLDAANGLVSDLSAITDDQNNSLGLSGEIVTSDDGAGGIQTSLQIVLADGISLGFC